MVCPYRLSASNFKCMLSIHPRPKARPPERRTIDAFSVGPTPAYVLVRNGAASIASMANAASQNGLGYIAITDHSRSCKLQRGLTPIEWLRQSNSILLAKPAIPVLHGIEVDILQDGSLDLPFNLLSSADFVVASVHSNWTNDAEVNTRRLISAIETCCIDVIGHPTSAVTGKPGVPDYVR